MMPSDVDFAFACTKAEGWAGETRDVFEAFLQHDPRGCLVAEEDSRPVGICIATRYRTTGFIGELVVAEGMRRKGIGRRLFGRAVDYLESAGATTICLDADVDAVPLYERMGFKKVCRSLRYAGHAIPRAAPNVRPSHPEDAVEICEIDRRLFGDDRGFFIARDLARHPDLCFVLESSGKITGYIFARPGVGVMSVGPWAACRGIVDAELLLGVLAKRTGAERLRMGILESNFRASELVRACGAFEETAPCWRMILGRGPGLGEHRDLFAIGSAARG